MIRDIQKGILSYKNAWNAMSKYKLWSYVVLPGMISLLLGGIIIISSIAFADEMGATLVDLYPKDWWGKEIIDNIATFISGLLMLAVAALLYKYIVMVVVAPFMSFLSEKLESKIKNTPPPVVDTAEMIKDIVRGLHISLRNLIRELFYVAGLTIAGLFVPLVGSIVSTVIVFLVQAYYAGFGNMDYTLERKRYTVAQSVGFVQQNRWLAIGNGAVFLTLILVPAFGIFLAPTLGTVSATLLCLDKIEGVEYSRLE